MSSPVYPTFTEIGEIGVCIDFGPLPTPAIQAQIMALLETLTVRPFAGLLEAVPGYTTLTVYVDPLRWEATPLAEELRGLLRPGLALKSEGGRAHVIPVCYEGEYAPDLAFVARHARMTPAEVVALHTAATYTVHLIGFAPGFAYLGGLDDRLHVPRQASPRLRVGAGSVGLAGAQTGIYPFEMPGGWQIIGQTRAPFFDARRSPPSVLRAGDTVRFEAVGLETFIAGLQGVPAQGVSA